MPQLPVVIQGGMGVGVSNWRLARAVSEVGQLGVVSGTALDFTLARHLQNGDPGGHIRRALSKFPFQRMAQRILDKYFIEGGKSAGQNYKALSMHRLGSPREVQELCIVGNFVEVFLAREGHDNPVGINYLEKVQLPHLPSLYGAMLAGVGYVLMGAGIPLKIPGALDKLAQHERATYPLYVAGSDDAVIEFDPREFMECELPPLTRPKFLAIIASNALATTMARKANGRVDGFVIEGPTAGGHNAPPRGKLQLDENGEAIYGERDRVDLEKIKELGLPFWLAGGYGSGAMLKEALAAGAAGIQAGTAFALCEESGLREDYKESLLTDVADETAAVRTDQKASPTTFPFKCADVSGTSSEPEIYHARPRVCDVGLLREAVRNERGELEYRCAAEPVSVYVAKGGKAEDTEGKKCLCNALLANIGLPQTRNGYVEPGLVTCGNDLPGLKRFQQPDSNRYSAADVIEAILND